MSFLIALLLGLSWGSFPARAAWTAEANHSAGLSHEARPTQNRGYRLGRVELRGPLDEVLFDFEKAGSTRALGPLAAGEQRELVLPFPDLPSDKSPVGRVTGAGTVAFRGWETDADELALPRSLYARVRPGLETGASRIPVETLLVLLAAGVLGIALRSRAFAALGAGVLLAGVAGWSSMRSSPAKSGCVLVMEGTEGEDVQAIAVTGTRLSGVDYLQPALLQISAASSPAHWVVELARSDPRASIYCGGVPATFSFGGAASPGPGAVRRESNGFLDLEEVWVREASGAWSSHGNWPLGAPLPASRPGGASPPGWLGSGLPQGRTVLLARVRLPAGTPAEVLAGGADVVLRALQRPENLRMNLQGDPEDSTWAWIRRVGF